MKTSSKIIAVTSNSFCKSEYLRNRILSYFPNTKFKSNSNYMNPSELADYLQGAQGAIIGLDKMDEAVLKACPDLKIVAKYGVGLDNLDLDAFKRCGVAVGWSGGVNRQSVAEQTLGFMIALSRNLYTLSLSLKEGRWHKDGGLELGESTIGIIGVGCIGKALIQLLRPFGSKILVNDIIDQTAYYQENGVTYASKKEIYAKADIISYHVPVTEKTKCMVNEQTLGQMKKTCVLVNTSRGQIIKTEDIKAALINGAIRAAAIDVYDQEPTEDNDLLALPNLFCTPHVAGNSRRAVAALGESAIIHLREFFAI